MMEECDMELICGRKTTPRCFNNAIGKVVVEMKSGESYDYFYCQEHKKLAERTIMRKTLSDKYGTKIPVAKVIIC